MKRQSSNSGGTTPKSGGVMTHACLGLGLAAIQLFFGTQALAQSAERGAYQMPYTRYEADAGVLSNANIISTTNFNIESTASEASQQKFVNLPSQGSSVEWTVSKPGDGVTLRFTLPDSADGKGLNGELDVYVNGNFDKTVPISSRWAWQYFVNKEPENHPLPFASTDYIAMRFDETHFILNTKLKAGDKIRIQKKNNDVAYGIDFIEVEEVPARIEKPSGYVSIADFGATPNDNVSDLDAFYAALEAAGQAGTGVYLPAGTWDFNNKVVLETSNIGIKGAGMWHTNVYYSNPAQFSGGMIARVNNVEVSDIYFGTVNTQRICRDMPCPFPGSPPYMIYKAFMGTWGNNSKFTRVWAEHFEVGAWIGGYDAPYPVDVTRNLVISHSRFRNNYADGINFAQGTSNSIVEHTNIRNSGDDGLAMWPSNNPSVPEEVNNIFRYNTVEHVFRAGGVAIFGGKDHQVHNMVIRDCFGGSAIRFTNDFPGFTFNSAGLHRIHDIDITSCGTSFDLWKRMRGAIEFHTPQAALNMQFENICIKNSQRHGIQLVGNNFQNVTFNNIVIDGTGLDSAVRNIPANVWGGVGIYAEANSGGVTFNNTALANNEDADSVNQNINFPLTINKIPMPAATACTTNTTNSSSSAAPVSSSSSAGNPSSQSSSVVIVVPSSSSRISSSLPSSSSSSSSIATGNTFTIFNRWQNAYLCDTGDFVSYSATSSGAACQWVTENVAGGFIEIRNQGTGDYMHIENMTGRIQATPRNTGWESSQWQVENVDGGFSRLKNRWQSAHYIHLENLNGFAQHGTIDSSWWSAQWKLTSVGGSTSSVPASSAASVASSTPVAAGFHIINRWKNTYLCDTGDSVAYSPTPNGACNWVTENVAGGFIEIRNLTTGDYMHVENLNGRIQATARNTAWDSSKWQLENVDGTFSRIKNRWQPAQFIHVENQNGLAQHGTIDPSWLSAQWKIVPTTLVVTSSSAPSSVAPPASSSSLAVISSSRSSSSSSVVVPPASSSRSSVSSGSSSSTGVPSGRGMNKPWTEYQLENGRLGGNAFVLAPNRTKWDKNFIQAEAIGRSAVQLNNTGDSVAITNTKEANSVVLRYSIPDAPGGGGIDATLGLYINGTRVKSLQLTSKYAWSYRGGLIGNPIVDLPAEQPHTFFDEVAVLLDNPIPVGAEVKIQRDQQDTAAFYVVDLIDLEQVAPPLEMPAGFTDVRTLGIMPNTGIDYADAISNAMSGGRKLWFPPGEYLAEKLSSGNEGMDNKGAEVRGAGMWYTTIKGPKSIFFCIGQVKCVFGDFSVRGESKARAEETEGVQKAFAGPMGVGSLIENVWVEHVVSAIWVGNDPPYQTAPTQNLTIRNVRIRNTYADGVNLDNGTFDSVVENSHFRNTGDDAAVVWSIRWTHWVRDKTVNAGADFIKPEGRNAPDQGIAHGNRFRNLTVQMPWRANCFAAYGGYDNIFEDSVCEDVLTYPGILIANEFSPYPFGPDLTIFRNISLIRAGGPMFFEDSTPWKHGALKFYFREGDVNDILVENLDIIEPLYAGIEFRGFGTAYVPSGEKFSQEVLQGGDTAVARNITLRNIKIVNPGTYGIEVLDGAGRGQVNFEGVTVTGAGIAPLNPGSAPSTFFNKLSGNLGW